MTLAYERKYTRIYIDKKSCTEKFLLQNVEKLVYYSNLDFKNLKNKQSEDYVFFGSFNQFISQSHTFL